MIFVKKNSMIFIGQNSIGEDSYFIRLSNDNTYYLHPRIGEGGVFEIKKGTTGAGIWKKEKAEYLMGVVNEKNLEIVKVFDILGNDGSLN